MFAGFTNVPLHSLKGRDAWSRRNIRKFSLPLKVVHRSLLHILFNELSFDNRLFAGTLRTVEEVETEGEAEGVFWPHFLLASAVAAASRTAAAMAATIAAAVVVEEGT